jgi:hypothetical protein
MKVHAQRLIGAVSLALTVSAVLAGGALADRPDDRAGMLGVGGASSALAIPDAFERAVARGIGERPVHPNDRTGMPGVGGLEAGPVPDVIERTVLREATPVRPDDVITEDGFQWGDAAFGAGAAFGLVLLAAGATATIRYRRRVVLS